MKSIFSCLLSLSALPLVAQQPDFSPLQLAEKMTREEKIRLVVGMGMKLPGTAQGNGTGVGMLEDKVPGAAGSTAAFPRLGLPATIVADGPAGLRISPTRPGESRTYYATAWPVATLLASSWDTRLVEEVGRAMGREVKEYGVDVLLAPGLNIHRNPLGGRNFEYYAEDPLVSGKMAAAMVRGIQSNGVGTSPKHFAVNNQETNRNSVNVLVSERALREIYLRGFEIMVKESDPWTIMSSYNYLNGPYTSENYDLLTTILRKEWGFRGLVMTDWFGGKDPVAQMKAGNDLLMPGTPAQMAEIRKALEAGTLDEKVLTENAARIIRYIQQTPAFKKYVPSNQPGLKAHAAIARRAAAEGMVLLKNEMSSLPFPKGARLAAFGITSYDFVSGGTGSGDVNEAYTVTLPEGLLQAGFIPDSALQALYVPYVTAEKALQPKKSFIEEFFNPTPRIPELELNVQTITAAADAADAALITLGRNAGEGSDRKTANDFNLKASEQQLLEQVSAAFHARGKRVVVVINAGGVIETASWRHLADAILLAWQPGLEAGNAVADVLSGKMNPSGKLATSFPLKYEDDITAVNFPGREFPEKAETGMMGMKKIPAEVVYGEGIYVGYRYYLTAGVPVAWPFGHGLSYTRFRYSPAVVTALPGGNFRVSLTVTNTGKIPGKEVVQLYVTAPSGKLDKPAAELKGFAKTRLLAPGQSQMLYFQLSPRDLASFDTEQTAWVTDAGQYTLKLGASSLDIRQTAVLRVSKNVIVQKCNKVLVPPVPIREWKK